MFFHPGKQSNAKRVTCTLTDGTQIQGWMWSFSHESHEGPDRDLVLSAPLTFQDAKGVPVTVTIQVVSVGGVRVSVLAGAV